MIPCSCSAHHTLCPCIVCDIRFRATQVAQALPEAEAALTTGLQAARPSDGLRSASYDASRHATGSHADPVLASVEATDTRTRSTVHKVREFQADALNALRTAMQTTDEAARYQHLRDARADIIEALTILLRLLKPDKTDDQPAGGDKGCLSCRRVKTPDGTKDWWTPTEEGERGHRALCHTCRKWADKRRREWERLHPGQPVADPRRFWPPRGAVEQYRDNGHMRATEAQWDAWDAADRKQQKGKKAS